MGRVVIACYRPKPGCADKLLDILREHVPLLRRAGLVTERPAVVLRAADGALLEIFEWRSTAAKDEAHRNPVVRELWSRFEAVCQWVPFASLAEAQQTFPNFDPVEL